MNQLNKHISFENTIEMAFNSISDIFFILDKSYRFQYLNASAASFFKVPKTEAVGKLLWEIYPFEEKYKLSDILFKAFFAGERVSDEYYSITHSRWFSITAYTWQDDIAVIMADIHKEKIEQQNLKKKDSQLTLILDFIPHIAFILAPDAKVTFLNKRWTEYTGLAIEEGMDQKWKEVIHPKDYRQKMLIWEEKSKTGQPFETKFRVKDYKGRYRWHSDRIVPIPSEDGTINMWVGTATDIDVLYRTQKKLEHINKLLQTVLNHSPSIILITNFIKHTNVYSNKSLERVLGFSKEYITRHGANFLEKHVHPDDLPAVFRNLYKAGELESDNHEHELEHRIKDSHGNWHWLLMKSVVFQRTPSGKIKEILNYFTDITPVKQAQEQLQRSLHFAKQITETSPDLILVFDIRKEKVVYYNKPLSSGDISARQLKALNSKEIRKSIHPDDWRAFNEFHNSFIKASDDDMPEIEYRAKGGDGDWRWLSERGKVFQRDKNGKVAQFIAIIQDINEKKIAAQKQQENDLLNQLVARKDEFISVASHEIRTPLTTIKASMQLMERLIESHSDKKKVLVYIGKANQQINKLTSLISDLLDHTRIHAGKLKLKIAPFSVNEMIENCIAHYKEEQRIIVKNDGETGDIIVEGDEIRLSQVLNNFLSNAIKYSRKNKEVIVESSIEHKCLKIAVTDFGIGIKQEKLKNLFSRFYRVDDLSQEFSGLGLGLYISAEIIRMHKGTYGVESEVGKGSTFWFKVPLKQPELMAQSTS